jgi:hypothetical protein
MADFGDEAEAINQLHLENSIAAAKQKAVFLKPKGFCHYCSEAILKDAVNQNFCDAYCRDDYSKYVIGKR